MTNSTKAICFFFLTAALWGATFPIIKIAVGNIDPNIFVFVRFILASLLMLPWIFFVLRYTDKQLLKAGLILGILNSGVYLLQTVGLLYISASRCAFITGMNVVFVPILAYLFRLAKLNVFDVVATLICLLGLYILTGANLAHINRGDVMVLLCAAAVAVSIIYLQEASKVCQHYSLLSFFQIAFTIPVPFFLVLMKQPSWPGLNSVVIAALIYCAILATIVPLFLQSKYQQYISATQVALIFALEPVFASFFSYWLCHEPLTHNVIIGGGLMLAGIILPIAINSISKLRQQEVKI